MYNKKVLKPGINMKKHKWEKAWEEKKFSIKTLVPSVLVSRYENELEPDDYVLDVGCGNGRNSIYLAGRGCKVDCFDVIDLQWTKNLSGEIKKRIYFKKTPLLEYRYKASCYRVVIVTRVIQYLNTKELDFLINKIKNCLMPGGFLLLSYTTKGGIFNRKEIGVSTYFHKIERVQNLLKKVFKNVQVSEGSKENQHVNYTGNVTTFDIYASNPYISNQGKKFAKM
jgi:cyclopropane fatty-acyl-phospholipid synthase-like methyltransferase